MEDSAWMPSNQNLRRVLNVMFPQSYIELYHRAPNSVSSLFNFKCNLSPSSGDVTLIKQPEEEEGILTGQQGGRPAQAQARPRAQVKLEASSEPSSRAKVVNLREQLSSSLVEHQAKAIGLCPIRRAIYDQCFDELIRQVTVSCIEQGLLLFRIRNELRMTINAYRRAYESGVKFGLNKAIWAELKLEQKRSEIDQLESMAAKQARQLYMVDNLEKIEQTNKFEAFDKIREYYESELAKKEQIILQQRNIIKALTQKYTNDIRSPIVEE